MPDDSCPFCAILANNDKRDIRLKTKHFFVIEPLFPALNGHLLIISKRHQENIFNLSLHEGRDLPIALREAKKILEQKMKPHGYNIVVHCGEHGGQTVFHLHIHLLPRFKDDAYDNRGGVIGALRKQLKAVTPPPHN